MDHVDHLYQGLNNSFCMCLSIVQFYLLLSLEIPGWLHFYFQSKKNKNKSVQHFSNDMPTRGAISDIFFSLALSLSPADAGPE